MAETNRVKLGDMSSLVKVVRKLPVDGQGALDSRRRMLADFCKLVGHRIGADIPQVANDQPPLAEIADLPPRLRQTLEGLLGGDSEKQIAHRLGLSRHTVHVYVKALYKRFGVSSRGELLARWVRR